jgi:hypothetical protein
MHPFGLYTPRLARQYRCEMCHHQMPGRQHPPSTCAFATSLAAVDPWVRIHTFHISRNMLSFELSYTISAAHAAT